MLSQSPKAQGSQMRWSRVALGAGLLWLGALGLSAGCGTTGTIETGTSGSTGTDGTDGTTGTDGSTGTEGSTGGSTGGSSSSGTTGGLASINDSTVSTLHFGVLGDCRPDDYVNTASQVPSKYPTQVITKLFQQVTRRSPQFNVFTGDIVYVYNPPDTTSAAAQIDQFLLGRNQSPVPFMPALGNHDVRASTPVVWQQKFSVPPYYTFVVHTDAGDARFVVTNDTYWDALEASQVKGWWDQAAKYRILIAHHPTDNNDLTLDFRNSIKASIASHPATLVISGHEHKYDHRKANELVLGLGGAQLTSGETGFGYAMVDQLSNGMLQVTVYNSTSDSQRDQWTVSP